MAPASSATKRWAQLLLQVAVALWWHCDGVAAENGNSNATTLFLSASNDTGPNGAAADLSSYSLTDFTSCIGDNEVDVVAYVVCCVRVVGECARVLCRWVRVAPCNRPPSRACLLIDFFRGRCELH